MSHWRTHGGDDPTNRSALRLVPPTCVVVEDGTRCTRKVAVVKRGWCNMHRKIAQNNGGDPTARQRAGRGGLQELVRSASAATGDECVIPPGWQQRRAGLRSGARPMAKLDGVLMAAARAVWTVAYGDPGPAHVLHTCHGGNGAMGCINIRHLYLGDETDNTRDRVQAQRQARGEGHGRHVLTDGEVHAVRSRHVPGTGPCNRGNTLDLAEEFGVGPAAIRNAVSGRSWKHLRRARNGDGQRY